MWWFSKKTHGFRCRGHPSGWTMRTSQGIPGGPVGRWGHPASRNCHRGSPGSFHSWRLRALAARCWEDGRLNRFLGLLQWMFWGCCLEKYGNTMKHRKCLPSILLEEFDFRALNTEHWIKHSSPFTIYQRTMQQHIRLSQNSWKMSKISPKSMPYILYLYYSIKIYVPFNVPWQYTSQ